jgi:hypothetical protein
MIWSVALPCSDTDAEVKKIQIRRGFSTFAAPEGSSETWRGVVPKRRRDR